MSKTTVLAVHRTYSILVELPVVLTAAPEGGFVAEVPALPGCITEGDTMDDLQANIRDAVDGWVAAKYDPGRRSYGCRSPR